MAFGRGWELGPPEINCRGGSPEAFETPYLDGLTVEVGNIGDCDDSKPHSAFVGWFFFLGGEVDIRSNQFHDGVVLHSLRVWFPRIFD